MRIKNHGIKWENSNSLQAFLRIMNTKAGLMKWVKKCVEGLDKDYATFIRFVLILGLRKEVRVFGDIDAHDYEIDFEDDDVISIFKYLRLALEKIYHEK